MILNRLLSLLFIIYITATNAQEKDLVERIKEEVNQPFVAILKRGTIIVNHKTKEKSEVPLTIKVKAIQQKIGGQYSDILTTSGERKYYTLTSYLTSVEEDKKLAPQVSNLDVYDYSGKKIIYNNLFETLTFLDYQVSIVSTDYYAEIYRAESSGAVESQFGLKQYFSHPKIPIDFGIAASIHRGFYTDDIGTITWNSFFVGPTVHAELWKSDTSALHLHVSAMKSLNHKSVFEPDEHKFSTNLLRIELSQSFKMKYGHFTLGGAVNISQASIKDTTEFLATTRERDTIYGFGATVGFYHPWILNL